MSTLVFGALLAVVLSPVVALSFVGNDLGARAARLMTVVVLREGGAWQPRPRHSRVVRGLAQAAFAPFVGAWWLLMLLAFTRVERRQALVYVAFQGLRNVGACEHMLARYDRRLYLWASVWYGGAE